MELEVDEPNGRWVTQAEGHEGDGGGDVPAFQAGRDDAPGTTQAATTATA